MCYRFSTKFTARELEQYYNAFEMEEGYYMMDELNGFDYPETAMVMDEAPTEILIGKWGLIPDWGKADFLKRSNTLNARIETLKTSAAFKNSVEKRCLIPAHRFYEWQWKDPKGKNKQKFSIRINGQDIFSLAGIYNLWKNPDTGSWYRTYSIITTGANELMSQIHNTKERMPVCLTGHWEKDWLAGRAAEDFAFPEMDPELIAYPVGGGIGDLFFPEVNSD